MKLGPLTFQCACFIWVCRSMASASRALHSWTIFVRICSERSFLVVYMRASSRGRRRIDPPADRSHPLLAVGVCELPDELGPVHVDRSVDGAGLRTVVVLHDLHH